MHMHIYINTYVYAYANIYHLLLYTYEVQSALLRLCKLGDGCYCE